MKNKYSKIFVNINTENDTNQENIEDISRSLKKELLGLYIEDISYNPIDSTPPGSKSAGNFDWSTLILTLIASGGVVTSLIHTISSFLKYKSDLSITLEIDGDKIEIKGPTDEEKRLLIEEWINRKLFE